MASYVVDVNLPYYFSLWNGPEYVHLRDIDEEWSDDQLWAFAKRENLTIITKDADFSERALLQPPPPRVIHIRLGNMRMRKFHQTISRVWTEACDLSDRYRLVHVFEDRLEGIG
jgi:predicted nuclease of predicted toxin-antitoxin system